MRTFLLVFLGLTLLGLAAPSGRGQDADMVRRLLRRLEEQTGPDRQDAFRDIMKLGPQAKAAVPVLIEALHGKNADVRQIATNVLAKIGKTAVPELTRALKGDNANVRRHASVALGTIGADAASAIPALGANLKDKDKDIRGF